MKNFIGLKGTKRLMELLLKKLSFKEMVMSEIEEEELREMFKSATGEELDLSWIASQKSVDAVKAEVAEVRSLVESCIEKIDRIGVIQDPYWNYIIGDQTELNKWTYSIIDNKVLLDAHPNDDSSILIYDMYELNGVKYQTAFRSAYNSNRSAQHVKFGDYVTLYDNTKMESMFSLNSKLITVDFGHLETNSVTTMKTLFWNCTNLADIKGFEFFDTRNVTNMSSMFRGCSSIISLDLTSFNTAKVTNFGWMFRDCTSLTALDLTSFDVRKATEMDCMFYGCTNLTEILVSRDKWVIPSGCNTISMFTNCGVDHVTYVD